MKKGQACLAGASRGSAPQSTHFALPPLDCPEGCLCLSVCLAACQLPYCQHQHQHHNHNHSSHPKNKQSSPPTNNRPNESQLRTATASYLSALTPSLLCRLTDAGPGRRETTWIRSRSATSYKEILDPTPKNTLSVPRQPTLLSAKDSRARLNLSGRLRNLSATDLQH